MTERPHPCPVCNKTFKRIVSCSLTSCNLINTKYLFFVFFYNRNICRGTPSFTERTRSTVALNVAKDLIAKTIWRSMFILIWQSESSKNSVSRNPVDTKVGNSSFIITSSRATTRPLIFSSIKVSWPIFTNLAESQRNSKNKNEEEKPIEQQHWAGLGCLFFLFFNGRSSVASQYSKVTNFLCPNLL